LTGIFYTFLAFSFNQLKFCANASWDPNATTFANVATIGANPYGIFIDTNNTVYAASKAFNQVLVWSEGSNIPIRNISGGLSTPFGIFVTNDGDIYVDNGASNHQVDKWISNATSSVAVMNVVDRCWTLFIDITNTLYCTNDLEHKIVKKSLNNSLNNVTIAAGTGTLGSAPNMLHWPDGIFVDMNLNLYVADSGNHRIQLFEPGQSNGTTLVINGTNGIISLNGPTGITLDADGYLFIVDQYNNRIIGSGSNGFRCLVGCSTASGSTSYQLSSPQQISFDNYGNMFVSDLSNNRIQKFLFVTNSCGEFCLRSFKN
jgi:sugar lactone lactonase YvrE